MKYFFIFFLFSHFLFSQTKLESSKIIEQYNLQDLKKIFSKKDSLRNIRVESFLEKYFTTNVFFKDKNNVYHQIYDIIDNKPLYLSTDNLNAARVTKINLLHSGGSLGLDLEGQNMIVGVWDGGFALKNHVEFLNDDVVPSSRVLIPQSSLPTPPSNDHATHVLGTLIAKGTNSSAKGMIPKATAYSYNWTDDISNVTSLIQDVGLLVSNHSYGVPVISEGTPIDSWIMGCYSSQAQDWDNLHFDAPYYLMITSAGNSGTDSYSGGLAPGYDKLTTNKNAKNNLVVANANPTLLPSGFISSPINASSSQGPTDDGRIKPDISGDGTNLFSTYDTSISSYATLSGTSMASPNVAGGALLLQQYYNQLNGSFMRSSTLKGLITHTAKESGLTGPDPIFGWGLLDASKAAQLITNDFSGSSALISENILMNSETFSIDLLLNNSQKLEATLCWIDPAGSSRDFLLNDSTPVLVNDLDLRITNGTQTFFPWKLNLSNVTAAATTGDNLVDNVEKVEVNNAIGNYTIQVSHKGVLQGGNQNFSLIVSGFDQSLGSEDFGDNILAVYPNPVTDKLFVMSKLVLNGNYKIFDVQGRLVVDSFVLNLNNFSIDLSTLKSGIYTLQLNMEGGFTNHKIIKK